MHRVPAERGPSIPYQFGRELAGKKVGYTAVKVEPTAENAESPKERSKLKFSASSASSAVKNLVCRAYPTARKSVCGFFGGGSYHRVMGTILEP